MAIPDFKSVMLTLLNFAADQQEHSLQDTVEAWVRLMIENNVDVAIATTYQVKKIDSDYFIDE